MANSFDSYMSGRAGTSELSESRYNLTIGAALTWGFFLNYLLMQLAGPAILNMIYRSPGNFSTFQLVFLIAYAVLVMIGSSMVRSYSPLKCFLGYNLIAVPVGVVVTIATLGYSPVLITRAVLITAIITLVMMIVSALFPASFRSMGRGLSIALLAAIIVESLALLLFRADLAVIDFIVVGIMSLYIGFDWVRANSVPRTTANAIAAASALYLDIINIFLRVLRILGRSRSRD